MKVAIYEGRIRSIQNNKGEVILDLSELAEEFASKITAAWPTKSHDATEKLKTIAGGGFANGEFNDYEDGYNNLSGIEPGRLYNWMATATPTYVQSVLEKLAGWEMEFHKQFHPPEMLPAGDYELATVTSTVVQSV